MNNLLGRGITHRMQHPAQDEGLFMEEALAVIRRGMSDEEVGEMPSTSTEPRTSGEQAGTGGCSSCVAADAAKALQIKYGALSV